MSVVVSDTSPLHYLILCGSLEVLPQLFNEVVIPPTVFQELSQPSAPPAVQTWAVSLPRWVRIQAPKSLDRLLRIDQGELEAICLAEEIQAAAILMDDRAGRLAARKRGLMVTGTIGVLELAAGRNWLQLPEAFLKLKQTNVRLDWELVEAALKRDRMRRTGFP